jgi:hypothetical protein
MEKRSQPKRYAGPYAWGSFAARKAVRCTLTLFSKTATSKV